MAEGDVVRLDGDASSLVNALEQASVAFLNFDRSTARITRDLATFNRSGNIVSRTIQTIDAAGNILNRTFTTVKDVVGAATTAIKAIDSNLIKLATTVEEAAAAERVLNTAIAESARVAQSQAIVSASVSESLELQAINARAAADSYASFTETITNAGAASAAQLKLNRLNREALEAEAAARKASVEILKEETATKNASSNINLRLIQTNRELLAIERSRDVSQAIARLRILRSEEAITERLTAAQETLVAVERSRSVRASTARLEILRSEEAITERLTAAQEELAAVERGRSVQLSVERLRALRSEEAITERLTAAQETLAAVERSRSVGASVLRLRNLRAEEATTQRLTAAAEALASAERARSTGRAIQRLQILREEEATTRRLIAAQQLLIRVEQGRVLRRAANRLQLIRQQNAELLRQARIVDLIAARQRGDVGIIRLIQQQEQLTNGLKKSEQASRSLYASLVSLGRVVGISLLIGGTFRLISVLTEATETAGELSIKIAEIETITKDASFTTEEWARGLRELAGSYGIDTIAQAEGAYQVLSNQIKNARGEVIQGAEALKFLDAANRLAVTGVTDAAAATNLLTAALNSFNIPAENAEVISAQLFKTVELGRVRIEEMSESFGRLAVPANQLGIQMEELLGAIAQTTIQGVKFSEASTLIRNVVLKLLRPTDEMKRVFSELGVASGEALIQSRGFTGTLAAIEKQVGGTSTELGKAFGRIRAITGALIFAGEGAAEAEEKIQEIRETTVQAFGEDTQRVIQSTGQQLKIAGEQARNFFEREIGQPALRAIAAWIEEAGGMERIIRDIIADLKTFGRIFAAAFAAKQLVLLFNVAKGFTTIEVATKAATVAQKQYNASLLATPVGIIAAAGVAIVALTEVIRRGADEQLRIAENANLELFKLQEDNQRQQETAERQVTQILQREIDRRVQGVSRFYADVTALRNKQASELADDAAEITRNFQILIKEFRKGVSSQLTEVGNDVKVFRKTIEDVAKSTRTLLGRAAKAQFEIDIDAAGVGQRIQLLENEILASRQRVESAAQTGNLKTFELERKRLDELLRKRIESQVLLARETSKLEQALQDEQFARRRATTREEKAQIDARIADLQRQQKILRDGTALQLEQERKLQKVREEARTAETVEEYVEALRQLEALKREQERINATVEYERTLRRELFNESKKQIEQLERIRQINEERRRQAEIEEQRIRSLKTTFELVAREASAFQTSRVTEGKTAEEINEALIEQQNRFLELVKLSRQITGNEKEGQIFFERAFKLREQAAIQLEKIATDAHQKRLKETADRLKADLDAAKRVSEAEKQNFEILANNLSRFRKLQIQEVQDLARAIGPEIKADTGAVAGPGTFTTGVNAQFVRELSSRFENTVEAVKDLEATIRAQAIAPDVEGELQIRELTTSIAEALRRNIQTGAIFAQRQRAGGELTAAGREVALLVAESQALLGVLPKIIPALSEFENVRNGIRLIEDALPRFTQSVESNANVAEELTTTVQDRVKKLREAFETGPQVAELAGFDVDIQRAAEETKRAVAEGYKQGVKEATPAAKDLGRQQAEAKAEREVQIAPQIAQQIAQIEAEIKARQQKKAPLEEVKRPEFERKPIDATIRLGPGAEPISVQQERIRQAILKEQERELKFRKELRELESEQRQRGATRVTGVNARGELVVRSAEGAEQLSTQQEQLEEQKKTNDLLRGSISATPATGREELVPSTGGIYAGQEEAEKALRRALGGGEELVKIKDQIKFAYGRQTLELLSNAETLELLGIEQEKARELALKQNNVTQASIDDLILLKDEQKKIREQVAKGTQVASGVATRDLLGGALYRQRFTSQILPFGSSVTPAGSQTTNTTNTNVGGITININESSNPQATAREVGQQLKRLERRGVWRS